MVAFIMQYMMRFGFNVIDIKYLQFVSNWLGEAFNLGGATRFREKNKNIGLHKQISTEKKFDPWTIFFIDKICVKLEPIPRQKIASLARK